MIYSLEDEQLFFVAKHGHKEEVEDQRLFIQTTPNGFLVFQNELCYFCHFFCKLEGSLVGYDTLDSYSMSLQVGDHVFRP
jgi:hypothetical protein